MNFIYFAIFHLKSATACATPPRCDACTANVLTSIIRSVWQPDNVVAASLWFLPLIQLNSSTFSDKFHVHTFICACTLSKVPRREKTLSGCWLFIYLNQLTNTTGCCSCLRQTCWNQFSLCRTKGNVNTSILKLQGNCNGFSYRSKNCNWMAC